MKIISWNVNSVRKREQLLTQILIEQAPDIVCLQEIKCQNEQFPEVFFDYGYNAYINGQKSYNGVAILSKKPMSEKVSKSESELHALEGYDYPEARFIKICIDNNVFLNAYVTNGQTIGAPAYYKQLNFLESVYNVANKLLKEGFNVFVAGDFNVAPEDKHADFALRSSFICCDTLRLKWKALLEMGLYDHFPDTYTWWDYRYKGSIGARIDCILTSVSSFKKAQILDQYRFNIESPSDHVPILLEI